MFCATLGAPDVGVDVLHPGDGIFIFLAMYKRRRLTYGSNISFRKGSGYGTRRRYARKTYGRKRTYSSRTKGVYRRCRAIARREVRKNCEVKLIAYHQANTTQNANTVYAASNLADVPQGAAQLQRVGDRFKVTGIYLRGYLTNQVAANVIVRVLVFWVVGEFADNDVTAATELFTNTENKSESATTAIAAGRNIIMDKLNARNIVTVFDRKFLLARVGETNGYSTRKMKMWSRQSAVVTCDENTQGAGAQDRRLCSVFVAYNPNGSIPQTAIQYSIETDIVVYYTDS